MTFHQKYLPSPVLAITFFGALLLCAPSQGLAVSLGGDLASFAILGGAGVAINGTGSVITGSVGGCCVATAVTGVIPTNFTISGGTVQMGGATAISAQGQLGTAILDLSALAPGTPETALGGLTLLPGVYTSAAAMNLTGVLTLDGGGNASAQWVFLVGSSLTTASGSSVLVQNTGAGADLFWVMGASASLGSNSVFEGNILANQSITLDTNVTIGCGRVLTQVASVTLAGSDTISTGCTQAISAGGGSNGFSGGAAGGGNGTVPEPATLLLLGSGLVGLAAWRWKQSA